MSEIDKTTDKYKVTLKFVNKILVNLDKEPIDDLFKFQDIDRVDLLKDVNKDSLKEMEDEIINIFSKKTCNYYRKSDAFVVNYLKNMVRNMDLQFIVKRKDITQTINGEIFRRTHVFYSIQ